MQGRVLLMISNKLQSQVLSPLLTTFDWCPRHMACTVLQSNHLEVGKNLPLDCRPVVMHSDHCAEKLLPWFDGMLEADEAYFKEHQESLFSSHMLDLSEDPKEKNIAICEKYFKRMAPIGLWLEMEIGITGGEEDGVDNTGADNSSLYTQPEDVYDVYKALSAIGPNFSIAAAFGNVHGVYKPGNVKLLPDLLGKHQEYVSQQIQKKESQPLYATVLCICL